MLTGFACRRLTHQVGLAYRQHGRVRLQEHALGGAYDFQTADRDVFDVAQAQSDEVQHDDIISTSSSGGGGCCSDRERRGFFVFPKVFVTGDAYTSGVASKKQNKNTLVAVAAATTTAVITLSVLAPAITHDVKAARRACVTRLDHRLYENSYSL